MNKKLYVATQGSAPQVNFLPTLTPITNETQVAALNSVGIGQGPFDFSDQIPGELITIDVTIDYQGQSKKTTTSFRIWF